MSLTFVVQRYEYWKTKHSHFSIYMKKVWCKQRWYRPTHHKFWWSLWVTAGLRDRVQYLGPTPLAPCPYF